MQQVTIQVTFCIHKNHKIGRSSPTKCDTFNFCQYYFFLFFSIIFFSMLQLPFSSSCSFSTFLQFKLPLSFFFYRFTCMLFCFFCFHKEIPSSWRAWLPLFHNHTYPYSFGIQFMLHLFNFIQPFSIILSKTLFKLRPSTYCHLSNSFQSKLSAILKGKVLAITAIFLPKMSCFSLQKPNNHSPFKMRRPNKVTEKHFLTAKKT